MNNYKCPCCGEHVSKTHFSCQSGKAGGLSTSDAKAEAARLNGAKGGRPKKKNHGAKSRGETKL